MWVLAYLWPGIEASASEPEHATHGKPITSSDLHLRTHPVIPAASIALSVVLPQAKALLGNAELEFSPDDLQLGPL